MGVKWSFDGEPLREGALQVCRNVADDCLWIDVHAPSLDKCTFAPASFDLVSRIQQKLRSLLRIHLYIIMESDKDFSGQPVIAATVFGLVLPITAVTARLVISKIHGGNKTLRLEDYLLVLALVKAISDHRPSTLTDVARH